MGVGFGPRSKMKGLVLISLVFLPSSFFIVPLEGAKGGAKSAMNRRGKSKDSGRRGQGAGREDDDEDIGGQGDKSLLYAQNEDQGNQAKAAGSGGGEHEEETTLYWTLPPQQGRKSQGFAWLFVEAPQARGQGEKGERARGEEGETGEGESFRDSGDGQRNVHLQKLNQLGFIYIDEEHFNRRMLCLTLMLEMSPIQKETK